MVMGSLKQETQVVVVGGGPGGYVAAIRAADLGKEVVLIESRPQLGGVCLIEGCIPSKALISAVELADAARDAKRMGLTFSDLQIDSVKLRKFAEQVINSLTKGVAGLLANRGVDVIQGKARFEDAKTLALEGAEVSAVEFEECIIATGSRSVMLPGTDGMPIWDAAAALELRSIPERLLVVGGGIIGLELGLVYAGLGSRVTVVEMLPQLVDVADEDLVKPLARRLQKKFDKILLEAKVTKLDYDGSYFNVDIEKGGEVISEQFEQVLVSVGRWPNSDGLGLENTKVNVDERGYIQVDEQMRTTEKKIFAIGDVVPGPGLAHKASREGKVAAEVISGLPAAFDNVAIPAVVYTDPEISWAGLTEKEAKAQGRAVKVGNFPLSALGRARTIGRTEGMAKVIADPETDLVLGVGLVGPHASELIAEAVLALEMGATLEDLTVTIHPHPTLSEALMEAAEACEGHAVHLPRKS
jgi:dihydrolipoamide dehydrogenase